MQSQHSPAFQAFVKSVNEDITGRGQLDSFDLVALHSLSGPERTQAEDLLIERLATQDDWRVPRALRELGSRRAQAALLHSLSMQRSAVTRIATARALWELYGDASGRQGLLDVLRDGNWSDRSTAASVLSLFPGEDTEEALLAALSDEDSTVRGNALRSLFELRNLGSLARDAYDPLGMLKVRLGSSLASVRAAALLWLRTILAALRNGQTQEALHLSRRADPEHPALRRLVHSLIHREDGFADRLDIAGLAGLAGPERDFAEHTLISRLPDDPRAARALGELGVTGAIAPLREVLTRGADDDLHAAVTSALSRLVPLAPQRGVP